MADVNVRVVKHNGKKPIVKSMAKTASEAMSKNSLVEFTSGFIGAADDNETIVYGVLLQEIAATDSDYASATKVQIELIQAGDEVEIDTSAELTVGTSYGISNAYTVDQGDTSNDLFTCTQVVSSTRAIGYIKSVAGGNTT